MLPFRPHASRASVAAVLALALAACTTPTRRPAPVPPAPPPAAKPTVAVTPPLPPARPTPEKKPATQPARSIDPAAAPVVMRLALQLHLAADEITVAQVARAEWPNSCLGLAAEGEICAQMITPGFAVSLIANGQRYEFRTDESGRRIRLAFAPLTESGEALLTWRDTTSFSVLLIGSERVAFGLRGGPMLIAPLPVPERAQELAGMLSRFAPFYVRTPAGELTVRGVGTGRATPTEQRQMAEWARLAWSEADNGLNHRAVDRAFVWRRQGGVAGFCDEVIVSRSGTATAWTCRHPGATPTASISLTPEELERLYRWIDNLSPFSWSSDDGGATADALTTSITLDGQGSRPLPDTEREHMLEFAHALVRRLVTASAP